MKMKKSILILCVSALSLLCACDKWLDVKPLNEQPLDTFWKTKEEVRSVLMGTYQQLRNCLNLMVQWGEVRSDEVDLGPGYTSNDDMLAVKSLEIKDDNSICEWRLFYNAIGRANAIIDYAPQVLQVDETFDKETCDIYVAEATWIKDLCYFYLVRTFWDVPYVTYPYLEDLEKFEVPQTPGDSVLTIISTELENTLGTLPITYGTNTWQNKGRATVWAGYALLADMYLWMEDYENCERMCSKLEASKLFELLDNKNWYQLYYPGNSDESIYELQYDADLEQTNQLFNWFYNESSTNNYAASETYMALFDSEDDEAASTTTETGETVVDNDIRGAGGSYLSASSKIWKYAGTARGSGNVRSSDQRDANWIIYRYADILLMHAECLAMQGLYEESLAYVTMVRERAGMVSPLTVPSTESDALDMVMDERERELCFEGKRWFDMVRMAMKKEGIYKDKIISLMLLSVSAKDRPLYKVRLQDTYGYFLPVNESDMDASGGALVQNPYYL